MIIRLTPINKSNTKSVNKEIRQEDIKTKYIKHLWYPTNKKKNLDKFSLDLDTASLQTLIEYSTRCYSIALYFSDDKTIYFRYLCFTNWFRELVCYNKDNTNIYDTFAKKANPVNDDTMLDETIKNLHDDENLRYEIASYQFDCTQFIKYLEILRYYRMRKKFDDAIGEVITKVTKSVSKEKLELDIIRKTPSKRSFDDIQIGDQITICLENQSNEFTATVQKIDHQNKRVLFLFDQCVAMMPMYDKSINGNVSYETSDLKKWIDTELYKSFPESLQCRITELTIPSKEQVYSSIAYDSQQLPLMKDVKNRTSTFDNRVVLWWLRSVVTATCFARINTSGDRNYGSALTQHGVRPIFWLNFE